ncbi:MAG: DUF58 domain-containing protein [Verrucomicrobia bacterium]|nr:DUF58 domain-containing protein [Verrucomicrobiota bacterium]
MNSLLDPEHLHRIAPLPLMARTAVEGFLSGMHRSVFHGFGAEFLHYRTYTQGEDLKYVDWKLYARRDKVYTKVFEEETNMNVYLVVDCSGSMGYKGMSAACDKLRYCVMLAACFAYLASKQGDNVSLLSYADQVNTFLPPAHRGQQLHRLLLQLNNLKAGGSAHHERAFDFLETQTSTRGLVILLSDMLEGEHALPARLKRLRMMHCDCIAIQILDPEEINLPRHNGARFQDIENGGELLTNPATIADRYDLSMQQFLTATQQAFHREQVDFRMLTSSHNLGLALAAYLNRRELRC